MFLCYGTIQYSLYRAVENVEMEPVSNRSEYNVVQWRTSGCELLNCYYETCRPSRTQKTEGCATSSSTATRPLIRLYIGDTER